MIAGCVLLAEKYVPLMEKYFLLAEKCIPPAERCFLLAEKYILLAEMVDVVSKGALLGFHINFLDSEPWNMQYSLTQNY